MKNQNILKRFYNALQGLKSAWNSERSFRTQAFITIFVIVVVFFLKASLVWWAIILLAIGATLAAELINTGMEYMLDFLHPAHHDQIGRAKDCAAAAVLILSITSILIFIAFLISRFS